MMSHYSDEDFWNRNKVTGAIVGSVVGVGMLACLIRRVRHHPQLPAKNVVERVSEMAQDVVGDNPLKAGQEVLVQQIVPVLKPVLLAMLADLEKLVENAFKRAGARIKKL
jgi:hypothetical protein